VPEAPAAPPRRGGPRWFWWAVAAGVGAGAAVVGVVVAGAVGGPSRPPATTVVVNQALAPSGLTATRLGGSSVQLRWTDNSGGRDGFLVEFEPPLASGLPSESVSPGSTSWLVVGTRAGQTCFQVRVVVGSDESAWPSSSRVCA